MTKRNYTRAAELIRVRYSTIGLGGAEKDKILWERTRVAQLFADFFKEENIRFDRDKFMAAVEQNDAPRG